MTREPRSVLRIAVSLVLLGALFGAGPRGSAGDPEKTRHLLYDVSPGEGFNLRREAFLRAALLVDRLGPPWVLVLPPFPRLRHWTGDPEAGLELPWSTFFDVEVLRQVVPVIEFRDYLERHGPRVDRVVRLSLPPGAPLTEQLVDPRECAAVADLAWSPDARAGDWRGRPFGRSQPLAASSVECLWFLAPFPELGPVLTRRDDAATLVDRLETAFWDASYSGEAYWRIRGHLVFAPRLRSEARRFVGETFGAEPYLAVHLRRGDFTVVRDVPSLADAAEQIETLARTHGLRQVFVATDASDAELEPLRRRLDLHVYRPSAEAGWRDGEIAIIDQLVAASGAHFVGTAGSTFTTVIMEERELAGKAGASTWNVLCPGEGPRDRRRFACEQPPQRPVAGGESRREGRP